VVTGARLRRALHSELAALPRQVVDGGALQRTAIRGDDALVTVNWIRPGHPEQPPHEHPFDQMSFVFAGAMEFEVGDERFLVSAGEVLQIPAGAPHTARVIGDDVALNIDLFAPLREDYLFLAEHQADAFS
jgi:quercetin dioxygenase-like cupin family protein